MTFISCNADSNKCEEVQQWKVEDYRIVESKCPDRVLSHYYTHAVFFKDKEMNRLASRIDSCNFRWQPDKDNNKYLIFDLCKNTIEYKNVISPNDHK